MLFLGGSSRDALFIPTRKLGPTFAHSSKSFLFNLKNPPSALSHSPVYLYLAGWLLIQTTDDKLNRPCTSHNSQAIKSEKFA